MTTYRGNDGVLKLATNAVAELTGFTINTNVGILDDTAQGDTARTKLSDALPEWSGSMKGWYYPTDTAQAAMIEGASLAFEGHPTGTTTGRQKLSGTAIIKSIGITSNNGEVVSFEAQFEGAGALARGTNS